MGAADADDLGNIGGIDGMRGDGLTAKTVELTIDGHQHVKADRLYHRLHLGRDGTGAAAGGDRHHHACFMQRLKGG